MTVCETLCLTILSLGMGHRRKHKKDGSLPSTMLDDHNDDDEEEEDEE